MSHVIHRAGVRTLASSLAIALGALALAACGDDPVAPLPTTPVALCSHAEWMAYRNADGAWTRVEGQPRGPGRPARHAFDATERLAVAMARMDLASPYLDVSYLTAAQAATRYACTDDGVSPALSTFSLEVRGLASETYAFVSFGPMLSAAVPSGEPARLLPAWPGTHDLVAVRFPPPTEHADRLVVRRAQSYAAGTSTTVDFDADEAFAPAMTELSWFGPRAHVQVNHYTAGGNDDILQTTVVGEPGTGDLLRTTTLRSMPASRRVAGDVHQVRIAGDEREVLLFYQAPRDRVLDVGPPLLQPTFTTLATTPYLRLRIDLRAQPEYGAVFAVNVRRPSAVNQPPRSVNLTATREHFGGTPATWSLEIPDFSGVPRFDARVGVPPGPVAWSVYATSAPLDLRPQETADGTVHRSARRDGTRP